MARRGANNAGRSDPLGIVGWVFADMLLALVLVFMGTQPGDPTAGKTPPATTTTTLPTTTTTPPTTTTTAPRGVDREYICLRVQTEPGRLGSAAAPGDEGYLVSLTEELRQLLASTGMAGREAGVVLSFGVSTTPGPGRATAEAYNELILKRLPEVFGSSAVRGFWDGTPGQNPAGSVMLNLYPFTDSSHPEAVPGSSQEC
jgi:hypothetical protein